MDNPDLSVEKLQDAVQRQTRRLSTAIWIFDFDLKRVLWANDTALEVWDAPSLEELRGRNLGAEMSETVQARLAQYKIDLADQSAAPSEIWTLYPNGKPQTLHVTYRGMTLPDGRLAMMCEGTRDSQREPETLRSAEALLHTPVMISLFSKDGQALYRNPAARTSSDCVKQTLASRFVDPEQASDLLMRLEGENDIRMVARTNTSNGHRWHEISAQRRSDAVDGQTVYLISEIDVTDLKEAEERAGAADRAKSEFLANMSHEIRTPLNGVMGTAELLSMTTLNTRQSDLVSVIIDSGEALLTIINDILDISKLAAGQMTIINEPFDLREMIDQVAALMAPNAAAKEIELIVRIDPTAPVSLIGDAGRVRQVVLNLVNNAVKFTETGTVFVDVSGKYDTTHTNWQMQCSVTDTGGGIPSEQLGKIFEQFAQVDGSSTRLHEGTGLGLSICSMLIELMSGRIDVKSTLGKGSTFKFEVDLAVHLGEAQVPAPEGDLRGAKILVIDDNAINRDILSELLSAWGIVPDTCNNGLEALAMIRMAASSPTPYDGVILDQQMPLMSGVDVMRVMQADSDISDLPVIMLTSVEEAQDGRRFQDFGVCAHLMKPVRSAQLKAALVRHLLPSEEDNRQGGAEPRANDLRSLIEDVTATATTATAEAIDVLICDDNQTNRRLMTDVVSMMKRSFTTATNGREAIKLFQEHRPRIVLMDVSMPDMDGIQATAAIRELEPEGKHTPIIAFTAHAIEGDAERFIASGMDDYLSKPISAKTAIEKIHFWIEKTDERSKGAA